MKFSIPLVLSFLGMAVASPPECARNNCLRAVAGTHIPGRTAIASSDCSRILASATVIQSTVTVYSNLTITKTINNKAKRATPPPAGIPTYAVGCDDLAEYASACSCFGVPGNVVTSGATTVTVIKTATKTATGSGGGTGSPNSTRSSTRSGTTSSASRSSSGTSSGSASSSSSSSVSRSSTASGTSSSTSASSSSSGTPTTPSPPACTANVKIDPLNCGKCGNVCPSGICSNGVCSSEICNAQTCGGFTNCNPNNTECFCFSAVEQVQVLGRPQNLGFCGENAVCTGLTTCTKSEDCNVPNSSGNVCAVNTCCGAEGVCLVGQCGNPARKLIRMSLEGSARFRGVTAAF